VQLLCLGVAALAVQQKRQASHSAQRRRVFRAPYAILNLNGLTEQLLGLFLSPKIRQNIRQIVHHGERLWMLRS
jgi:hypothetical protein